MDPEASLALYYSMLRIRIVEERIAESYPDWQMRCPVHLCIGQEAIAAGVCSNLRKEDYLLSNHRSHGHYLAKGGNLRSMMAEIYGKKTGCSQGKGGSMHLVDLDVNILGTTPIVGGMISVATGVALGIAMKEEDRLAAVFFGDAATEEGVFCESLNFASLKKLPILYVCENNFFSVYSPLSVRQPEGRDNITLVGAYGIKGAKGYGNSITDVHRLSAEAVAYVREGLGPYYLQFDTYRWREHCGPFYDNNLGYRSESEAMEWQKNCPVETYRKQLFAEGLLTEEKVRELTQEIEKEVDDAFEYAKTSPFPEIESMNDNVYSECRTIEVSQ